MISKEFEEGITNFNLAKNTGSFIEEEPAPAPVSKDGEAEPVQTASISSGVFRLLNKSSADLVANRPKKAHSQHVSLDEVEASMQGLAGKEGAESPINKSSLNNIMEGVQSEDDLTRLIETSATFETQNSPRTFKDIAGDFTSAQDVLDEMSPIFKGQQSGLLTDRQLYGVRSLMVTASENAVELAERIAMGDHTPALLLEYQNAMATYNVLSKYSKGQASEIARALNSQKMVAQSMNTDSLKAMDDAIEQAGGGGQTGDTVIIKSAKNLAHNNEKHGGLKATEDATNRHANPLRVAVEYWKNNILSGWETHAVNITSVGIANLWDNYAVRPVAGVSGALRQMGGEPIDRVYQGEVGATIIGSAVGIRGSLKIMAKTLMTGESAFGAGKAEYGGALHQFSRDLGLGKFGEVAADASSMSFRLLRAEDDVMRGIGFSQQLYALAYRDAKMKGLAGEEMITHMNKLIEDPPSEMYDSAADFATKTSFTNTDQKGVIGVMAQGVRTMVGAIPPLQFMVPFVNTPANLLQYAVESSILSVGSTKLWKEFAQGGASRDVATAKMVTGTALTVSLWQAYEAGIITGGGPHGEWKGQEMMEREGWKPFAIVSDGKHYGTERLEPFSTSIAFATQMFEKAKYAKTEEDAKKYWVAAIISMSEPALESTWLSGVNDLVEATHSETALKSYLTNLGSGFVPYSASLKSIKRMQDPIEHKVSKDKFVNDLDYQLAHRIKANLPILSEYVRPARYWDGKIIDPGAKGFAYAVSVVKKGKEGQSDPINRQLLENGIYPPEPSSVFSLGPTQFSLLELDPTGRIFDMYIKHVGEGRRKVLSKVIEHRRYNEQDAGPNGVRWKVLTKGLEAGKMVGMETFLNELEGELDKNPELANAISTKFAMDPRGFIKMLYHETRDKQPTAVKTKALGVPTRGAYEIPRMQK